MRIAAISASICLLLAGSLRAQDSALSLQLRLGRFDPRIDSVLWDENALTFTASSNDFDALMGGVELGVALAERLDLSIGVETGSRKVSSMYRDFVRTDGTEVIQELSLRTTPVTVGLRLLPAGREHRLAPYVGGGGSFYFYEYMEEGEFIDLDLDSLDIFVDRFVDEGVAFGGYVVAGLDVALAETIAAFVEYRRHWAEGEHGDDFAGYGGFDLSAHETSFGARFRF